MLDFASHKVLSYFSNFLYMMTPTLELNWKSKSSLKTGKCSIQGIDMFVTSCLRCYCSELVSILQSVTMFPANVSTVRSHEKICWSVFSVDPSLSYSRPRSGWHQLSPLTSFVSTLQLRNKIDNLIACHLATLYLGQNIKMSSSRVKSQFYPPCQSKVSVD